MLEGTDVVVEKYDVSGEDDGEEGIDWRGVMIVRGIARAVCHSLCLSVSLCHSVSLSVSVSLSLIGESELRLQQVPSLRCLSLIVRGTPSLAWGWPLNSRSETPMLRGKSVAHVH